MTAVAVPVLPSEEEILLTRSEATRILTAQNWPVFKVVRCCDDGAVLYLDKDKLPMTAWINRDAASLDITREPGWPAVAGISNPPLEEKA